MHYVKEEHISHMERRYPFIIDNPDQRRYLAHCQFGRKDINLGITLITRFDLLKLQYGYKIALKKWKADKTKTEDFITHIKTFPYPPQIFTAHNKFERQARCVATLWDEEDSKAIDDQMYLFERGYKKEDLYNPYTGKKYNTKDIMLETLQQKEEAEITIKNNATFEQQSLIDYLHSVDTSHFTKLTKVNLSHAYQSVLKIEKKSTRDHQSMVLHSVILNPKPIYLPSRLGNTMRIYSSHESMCSLKKEIRKILCKGWCEFDLKSAQFSIIAKLWNIDYLNDYLKDPSNSLWKDLHSQLNIVYSDETKAELKKVLYSVCFGSSQENIHIKVRELFGIEVETLFIASPIIQALYKARSKRISEIYNKGGITTVYGKTVEITGSTKDARNESIRSMLAQECQAMEFKLLEGVMELAKTTTDWYILLYQHDGFSVRFTDKTKQDRWIKRIQQVVLDNANRYNVHTCLEVEVL